MAMDRTPLLVVALALGGALGGFGLSLWLYPARMPQTTALVGAARPALELPDLDGSRTAIARWDGRLLLLNFWASWCGPCIEEMPLLERTQRRHAGAGLQIVGIAADGAQATRAFLGQHPVTYPILVDDPDLHVNDRDSATIYGNDRNVLPYSVLISRDGHILAQRFGNFTEDSLERWLAPHL